MYNINSTNDHFVEVIKSDGTGKVINTSAYDSTEGWIMVYDKVNERIGFINDTLEALDNTDLAMDFKEWVVQGINCEGLVLLQEKGFIQGQKLPGRVGIKDTFHPVLKHYPEFCKHIPQMKYGVQNTPRQQMIIIDAYKSTGISYKKDGKTIYRKYFYSPYPYGHPRYEADIIIRPDNIDEVNAFINSLQQTESKPNKKELTQKEISVWEIAFEHKYLIGYKLLEPRQGIRYQKYGDNKHKYILEHFKPLADLGSCIIATEFVHLNEKAFIDYAQILSGKIQEQLGIRIHPLYIQYSIAHNKTEKSTYMEALLTKYNVLPIAYSDLNGIRESLLSGGNPFYDGDGRGALNRLRNIALGNSAFVDS